MIGQSHQTDKYLSDACEDTLWQECKKGHRWEVTSARARSTDIWCPICTGVAIKTIEDMQDLVADRHGWCLSETYKNARTKLLWECSEGHQWEAPPGSITSGSWCPHCAGNAPYTIEDMQDVAAEHDGKCLSEKYTNNITKLEWECSEGHRWEAMPMKVLSGNWCRKCYNAKQRKRPKQEQTA